MQADGVQAILPQREPISAAGRTTGIIMDVHNNNVVVLDRASKCLSAFIIPTYLLLVSCIYTNIYILLYKQHSSRIPAVASSSRSDSSSLLLPSSATT